MTGTRALEHFQKRQSAVQEALVPKPPSSRPEPLVWEMELSLASWLSPCRST